MPDNNEDSKHEKNTELQSEYQSDEAIMQQSAKALGIRAKNAFTNALESYYEPIVSWEETLTATAEHNIDSDIICAGVCAILAPLFFLSSLNILASVCLAIFIIINAIFHHKAISESGMTLCDHVRQDFYSHKYTYEDLASLYELPQETITDIIYHNFTPEEERCIYRGTKIHCVEQTDCSYDGQFDDESISNATSTMGTQSDELSAISSSIPAANLADSKPQAATDSLTDSMADGFADSSVDSQTDSIQSGSNLNVSQDVKQYAETLQTDEPEDVHDEPARKQEQDASAENNSNMQDKDKMPERIDYDEILGMLRKRMDEARSNEN